MEKAVKPRGRPLKEDDQAMPQIALRLSKTMLSRIQTIIDQRYGHADRTAVIRELLDQALTERGV